MDTTAATPEIEVRSISAASMAMELLDRYGTSNFVDAIESSRFNRAFRKQSNVYLGDDFFWNEVKLNLNQHAPG
jgi:hypothetical protein